MVNKLVISLNGKEERCVWAAVFITVVFYLFCFSRRFFSLFIGRWLCLFWVFRMFRCVAAFSVFVTSIWFGYWILSKHWIGRMWFYFERCAQPHRLIVYIVRCMRCVCPVFRQNVTESIHLMNKTQSHRNHFAKTIRIKNEKWCSKCTMTITQHSI